MIEFHDDSSSNTLIKQIFLLSKIDLITAKGQNRVWHWPRVGEMSFQCTHNPTCSSGVAFSSRELTWLSNFTKSPDGGNSLPLDEPQREICCVKSASNLTISGNIWFLNHRRQQNVSWSLSRSLPIYSRHLSEAQGGFQWCNFRVAFLDRRWGMRSIAFNMKIPCSRSIKGSWLWPERSQCTSQEHDGRVGWVQVRFGSSWIGKRWCGNGYWNRKDYQHGKSPLKSTNARYLTRSR